MNRCRFVVLFVIIVLSATTYPSVYADDSAAAIAAGGLVARRETRVVMAKEILKISPQKVVVNYDFRNDTDEDVTTEVAFPIPPYENDWVEKDIKERAFSDFRLWVDGKPTEPEMEVKALLKGKEITSILQADRIDIPTFGHADDDGNSRDFLKLPKGEQNRLKSFGFFSSEKASSARATWIVRLQYHWTQTFPAHRTVTIRHEYTPAIGFQPLELADFRKAQTSLSSLKPKPLEPGRPQNEMALLASFCPDTPFLQSAIRAIEQDRANSGDYAYPEWVDFILTSANTWKQPIEDFTLTIERSISPVADRKRLISFCSPGAVDRIDDDHFQVHLTNFIPSSELHIGFFDLGSRNSVRTSRRAK